MLQVSYEDPSLESDAAHSIFARFFFNGSGAAAGGAARDFETGLSQVGGPAVCEVWRHEGQSKTTSHDGVNMVLSAQYLLVSAIADSHDMRADSHDVYLRLLRAVAENGYPNIIRTWNSVPDINAGTGDDECYKQFCVGRSEAFDACGGTAAPPPAATAVGTVGRGPLRVFILASHKVPALLENSRQVSAYRYPRQYGPRSPAFSRAAVLNGDDNLQVYLSGTAAITGHESRHAGDAQRQIEETLENVRHLAVTAGVEKPRAALRIYLRDPQMHAEVLRCLEDAFTYPPQVVVLEAELCRRELLIEIDGVLRSASV